ncbi:hypothetical protein VP01_1976g2 [Puccinia sorghi]|uniref:Uncharacterized protein n=1 Tax=Puccinia sorghi TaxID=27349 RepID=A0A0L6VC95_9BASI|nr:hypothetical protein VP01_1976g2 [Puccinia sorghi]
MALLWNFIDKIMQSDKELDIKFFCNHLIQFHNESGAESKDKDSKNVEAALYSQKGKSKAQGNANPNGQFNTSKRCRTCYHNTKQDRKHSKENCWYLYPKIAPKEL